MTRGLAPGSPRAGAEGAGRIFTVPFVSLMVANGLLRICTFMLIALVPLYVVQRGFSTTVAGLTTTCYMLAAVLVRPLSGRLVDTRGRYIVMVLGALLYMVATGLYVPTLPVWALLAVRALQGLGFSFNGTAVTTLATDLIPEGRMAEGLGYLGIEQTVAQLFAPWFALTLLGAFGYRVAFSVVFALGVLNLLVRFPLRKIAVRLDRERRAAERARDETGAGPWWSRIVDEHAWRPSLIMFFLMFGGAAVNTFMAVHAIGHGIANAGLYYTASAVAVAVARLLVGRIERRFGAVWIIAPGITLIAAGLLGIAWSPGLPVLMAAGACYGLGFGSVQPGLNSMAVLSAARESRGLANSTFFMAMDLSQAIGAVALGALASAAGTGSVFVGAAAMAVLTFVLYFVLRARGFLS
ncbi:MFS transporter [Amycolatopsis acidicola]|uniref:MFS transporter n=1 Tax=Amycolatopsis acidicola TaxID=2596893 RepID=A0A5N0V337_9PSEU|nr:MFS transporter [Amycolatopsis acidicola]KAA9159030.1 MFS transporter [Amycolatopsis acidicola]